MSDTEHPETLRAAERRLQAAQLSSDVTALGELLDDAVLFTGPDRNLYTKEDDLGAHRSGEQTLTRVEESERHRLEDRRGPRDVRGRELKRRVPGPPR